MAAASALLSVPRFQQLPRFHSRSRRGTLILDFYRQILKFLKFLISVRCDFYALLRNFEFLWSFWGAEMRFLLRLFLFSRESEGFVALADDDSVWNLRFLGKNWR